MKFPRLLVGGKVFQSDLGLANHGLAINYLVWDSHYLSYSLVVCADPFRRLARCRCVSVTVVMLMNPQKASVWLPWRKSAWLFSTLGLKMLAIKTRFTAIFNAPASLFRWVSHLWFWLRLKIYRPVIEGYCPSKVCYQYAVCRASMFHGEPPWCLQVSKTLILASFTIGLGRAIPLYTVLFPIDNVRLQWST